jgi:NADH-quinone oxidoreductase subunit E
MAHIQVCGTTPCMLRGSGELIDICRRRIHHDQHHLAADGRLSWEEVECLGACVNAPMIQVSKDTYEDLTPKIFEGLLDAFERGETPSPGPQTWRQFSMPESGPTSLLEIQYAEDDVAPARAKSPTGVHVAADARAARQLKGAARKHGETDPASQAAANQNVGRVDPSGTADEAAARSNAASGPSPKAPKDTLKSGPKNPGTRSDSDSPGGGKSS